MCTVPNQKNFAQSELEKMRLLRTHPDVSASSEKQLVVSFAASLLAAVGAYSRLKNVDGSRSSSSIALK